MSDKPKCAWCKIDTEKQISVKSDELPIDEKHSRHYPVHKCPTCGGLRDSGQEHIRIHNMRQIYEGCLQVVWSFISILEECMGNAELTGEELAYDLGIEPNEKGGIDFSISNHEIVQDLFLSHTGNAGGTSTRILMNKLGIEHNYAEFTFGEMEDDEEE